MLSIEKIKIKKLNSKSIFEKEKLTELDVSKYVINVLSSKMEDKGFANIGMDDFRFVIIDEDGLVVFKYFPELLKTENKHWDEVKNATLYRVLNLKDCLRFRGKIYSLKEGVTKEQIINFIKDNYNMDYPEFDEEKWGKYLADYPIKVEQVVGRVVKLTYRVVDNWCGDEFRGGDCYRSAVTSEVNTAWDFYDEDLKPELANELLVKILAEFYRELKSEEIRVNVSKLTEFLNSKRDAFIEAGIEKIKSNPESYYNALINDLKAFVGKNILHWKNINEVLDYSPWRTESNLRGIYKIFANNIHGKLVDDVNEFLSNLNIEVYEVYISFGRWSSNTYYVYISDKRDILELHTELNKVGPFIGKQGRNIKEIAKEIGVSQIKIKQNKRS